MKLASAVEGSTVEVLSAAGEVLDNTKMRKAVLSRGPSKLYGVKVSECGDLYSTASLLARAVEQHRLRRPGHLRLKAAATCTLRSLAACWALSWASPRSMLWILSLGRTGAILARRGGDNRKETFRLSGPAVISVTSDICRSHIPSMKDILAARQKAC